MKVKGFFFGLLRVLGYGIMSIGLFALVCPLLFPFPMWEELRRIFNIVAFILPIGFVIRFIGMHDKELFERPYYLIKDLFVLLGLVSLPNLALTITYYAYHNEGVLSIIKGLLAIAIAIVGYILIDRYIKDKKKERDKAEEDEDTEEATKIKQ